VNDIETQDLLLMDKGELISKIKQLEEDYDDYKNAAQIMLENRDVQLRRVRRLTEAIHNVIVESKYTKIPLKNRIDSMCDIAQKALEGL